MRENIEQIYQYAWKIWRWRWIALGVAAVVCAAGWAFVAQMPDKYESMARVFLDNQSMLRPALKGLAVDDDMMEKIALTSRQTLLSRPNMEKVARDTDLDLGAHTPAEKERLLAVLAKQIEVTGNAKDSIYIIKYRSNDPILAKNVVESLLSIFVENTLGAKSRDSELTGIFLEKQIQEYEVKLLAAEDRLKEFKRANVGLMPTEAGGYFSRIQNSIDNLDQAKLLLSEAIQRREALKLQLSGVLLVVPVDTSEASILMEKVSNMERHRDALMLQFTDKHPDVIAVRQKIITLKKQQEAELISAQTNNRVAIENPVYQELTIELGKIEAEVAALRARKREWQRKVSGLKLLVNTAPQVEADLLKLNRDYEVNKVNYQDLVSRREAAKITGEIGGDDMFRVIDPPVVPVVPVGPGRPILMSMVLLAGLGVGIAFAFLLSQLKPTFDNTNELSSGAGFPVYGNISTVWKESELLNKKSNLIVFSLAVLALFVAYGVVIGIQIFS